MSNKSMNEVFIALSALGGAAALLALKKKASANMPKYHIRECDAHGCGHFGASRGNRDHNGIDLVIEVGEEFKSTQRGTVTKLGWAYPNRPERYVEVTNGALKHRYFYVQPSVSVGQSIKVGDVLGTVMQLPYNNITPHVHYEIMNSSDDYIDPTSWVIQPPENLT